MSHSHSHDGAPHSHGAAPDHGHTHEILDGPGSFLGREMPIIEGRNWEERAFTVGIGGYVILSRPFYTSTPPYPSPPTPNSQQLSRRIHGAHNLESTEQDADPHSPVGSGKTALMLALCKALRARFSIAAVTNDIFTREDCEFLTKNNALPA